MSSASSIVFIPERRVEAPEHYTPEGHTFQRGRKPVIRSNSEYSRNLQRLYAKSMIQIRERQQWQHMEREQQRICRENNIFSECTFSPSISKFARSISRPRSASPEYRYDRECQDTRVRRARAQAERDSENMRECTFRPLTLSAAKIKPLSFTKCDSAFNKLHNEAAHRKNVRQRLNLELASKSQKETCSKATIDNIVDRLSTVHQKEVPPESAHKPIISQKSVELARLRYHRQKVVEELLEIPDRPRPVPSLVSPNSEAIVCKRRVKHLKETFRMLAEGRQTCDVISLAQRAKEILPAHHAHEIVRALLNFDVKELISEDFVEAFSGSEFADSSVAQPQKTASQLLREARSKDDAQKECTFHPEIDPTSRKIVNEAKKQHKIQLDDYKKQQNALHKSLQELSGEIGSVLQKLNNS